MRKQQMVRVLRSVRYPSTPLDGFVVGLGKKWVLLAVTGDGGYLEGWTAVRIKQVDRLRKAKTFELDFAKMQPGWPPRPPESVDLDTTAGVLRSLQRDAGLISIEQEDRLPDAEWVGRVDDLTERWLWLHEVDPKARWHDSPNGYRLRNITTVSAGSRYLTALEQVVRVRDGAGQS